MCGGNFSLVVDHGGNDTYVEVPGSADVINDSFGTDVIDFLGAPFGVTLDLNLDAPIIRVEIPNDLQAIKKTNMALAQDWRSHLAGQRVHARPDTIHYRMLRVARRQRTPLVAGGAAVVGVGGGLEAGVVVTAWVAAEAARAAVG